MTLNELFNLLWEIPSEFQDVEVVLNISDIPVVDGIVKKKVLCLELLFKKQSFSAKSYEELFAEIEGKQI